MQVEEPRGKLPTKLGAEELTDSAWRMGDGPGRKELRSHPTDSQEELQPQSKYTHTQELISTPDKNAGEFRVQRVRGARSGSALWAAV